ncbi:MAG: hypothetical protein E3J23_08600 [Candidatus Stahlbacteria bacterium]|nr:MAG: hypothetical protein E3J23_08600 [Candidatus Stahlbacteria bacterium]
MNHLDEIKCQYECLKILSGGDINKVNSLVESGELPALFRKVITMIEQKYNRVPEPEELIYITAILDRKRRR